MEAVLIVFGVIGLIALIWFIATYNRFVRLRQHMKESWADVDVELKRRYDLIPNLINTVKGYAKHEREVLERVVELRNQASANHGSASSQASDETAMLQGLRSVFVLAEGYPELKADSMFRSLTDELARTEDRIAAARRFFNGNVRELNQLREMFPTSTIAGFMGVEQADYFELSSDLERVVPRVAL